MRPCAFVCALLDIGMCVLLRFYVRPSAFVCASLGVCMRVIISSLCILYVRTWTRVCAPLGAFVCASLGICMRVLGRLYAWMSYIELHVVRTYTFVLVSVIYSTPRHTGQKSKGTKRQRRVLSVLERVYSVTPLFVCPHKVR